MLTKETFKILDMRRTLPQRIATATVSYSMLAFCIWLSQGSKFWTLVCGLIFLIGFAAQLANFTGQNTNKFKSVKELQDWANGLEP